MTFEFVYNVIIPGESWSGHVMGGPKGGGIPGKLTGGVVEAEDEKEATRLIMARHGPTAQIVPKSLQARIALIKPE
jgi:hypothetical protein